MAEKTYKLVEIVGTSESSISEAMKNGVRKAAQSLHNLDWVEVQEIRGHIDKGELRIFQVKMKIGFRLD